MKEVVDAIATYYHEVALSEAYARIASTNDNTETFSELSKKHQLMAEQTYDYIVANFQEDIARQSQTIKEHFAGAY